MHSVEKNFAIIVSHSVDGISYLVLTDPKTGKHIFYKAEELSFDEVNTALKNLLEDKQ